MSTVAPSLRHPVGAAALPRLANAVHEEKTRVTRSTGLQPVLPATCSIRRDSAAAVALIRNTAVSQQVESCVARGAAGTVLHGTLAAPGTGPVRAVTDLLLAHLLRHVKALEAHGAAWRARVGAVLAHARQTMITATLPLFANLVVQVVAREAVGTSACPIHGAACSRCCQAVGARAEVLVAGAIHHVLAIPALDLQALAGLLCEALEAHLAGHCPMVRAAGTNGSHTIGTQALVLQACTVH
mmetsp:Transcript_105969/g.252857  ORF Transcript_105969/g.252857 Transcript_105969/m.252857 type:complete len:242 (+) Transcript_105969:977-1702(+)